MARWANHCREVWPARPVLPQLQGVWTGAMESIRTMSWDDVHRLELQLRARSAAIGRKGHDPCCCPGCGRAFVEGDGGMELGGVTVHPRCLPALRTAS